MAVTEAPPAPPSGGRTAAKAAGKSAGKKGAKGDKKPFLKSKKGIIAIVAVLAVGGGAYKMMAPAGAEAPVAGASVPLDATTLNLQGGHYLKIAVAVVLADGKATAEEFDTSKAAELVIDEFSDRSVASISTNASRRSLVKDLQTKVVKAYDGEVFGIHLTQFVTQ